MIFSSPIVSGEDGPPPGMTGGSYEFGVDPNLDPELALVNLKGNLRLFESPWKKSELELEAPRVVAAQAKWKDRQQGQLLTMKC